jgi:lipopolysaccharide exporter
VSLAVKATRSAAWMFLGGMTSQAVGLFGTLALVRFITPGDYGEAMVAAVVVGTAGQFSSLGIGSFVIVKARDRRDLAFHATFYQLLLGAIAVGAVLLFRGNIGNWVHAPAMARYVPGMALSMMLDKLWLVPERTLMREMRFKIVALSRTAGELTHTSTALVLAILGWGGMAIIIGNIARSTIRAGILCTVVDRRDWFEPSPITRKSSSELFVFGVPLSIGSLSSYASRKWDNLLVSHFFGPAVMAAYNLAYSLAETPSALIGDQVVDVILPSLTRVEPSGREDALQRGAALMSLITSPLAVGLGAVSVTVVSSFLDQRWVSVGPMLAVLSVISVTRPPAWISGAYLQARDRSTHAMALEILNAAAILISVGVLSHFGALWACIGVGIGTTIRAVAGAYVIRAVDGISAWRFLSGQLGPLVACAPMVGAVLGIRWVLHHFGIEIRFLNLAIEVTAGGLAYLGGVFIFAGETARDFIHLAHLRRVR